MQSSATIALVGPMTGPLSEVGLEMRQAIHMYIEEINQAGGVNGQKVQLLVYDDQSSTEKAQKIAKTIAFETEASIVISNLLLENSAKLGKSFEELKLPIITASVAEDKDFSNPWLFSTLFDNHSQGAFIASYMLKIMKYNNVSIIYSDDAYGQSLTEEFSLPYKAMGGKINNTWLINSKVDFEQTVIDITQDLLSDKAEPSVILLATQAVQAAEIVVALKRRGLENKIFGPQSLTDDAFSEILSKYPENKINLGYFSDGIMATSPLIYDVASREAQIFRNNFIAKYNRSPGWVEAAYYDTAHLAVTALDNVLPKNSGSSKEIIRQKVRDYLASLDSEKKAIKGLNDDIYFSSNENRIGNIMVGQFFNHKLISAYNQLDLIKDPHNIVNLDEQMDKGNIITINSKYLYKTDIIFTGIDFIDISDLDLKTSSYVMDFYLWFRYRGNLDVSNIEFINQVEPIELPEPFKKSVEDGVTYEAYRIEAKFLGAFDFSSYPFDSQKLTIQFRHKTANRDQAIYIRDDMGMRFQLNSELMDYLRKSKALESWNVVDAVFFKDFLLDTSGAADLESPNIISNYEYSRFNAQISIERKSIKFVVKNLLPLFILLILIFLVAFTDFATRISVYVGAVLAAVFEHVRVSNALPGIGYTTALDYIFYSVYFLTVIEITISIIAKNKENKENFVLEKRILNYNKIFLTLAYACLAAYFSFHYDIFSLRKPVIVAEVTPKTVAVDDRKFITLSSWRSEDQKGMDRILKVFNDTHKSPVRFDPIQDTRYRSTIETLLDNDLGPDLFYLDGNVATSKVIINNGHTLPLPEIPIDNLTADEKEAWTSKGVLQAVPVQAVAQGVYFNQNIFNELKLPIPKTYEEFLSIAHKIKNAGIIPLANGIKDDWANAELIFMSMAPNFIGGQAGRISYSEGKRCFNDEHMVKLYQGIASLSSLIPKNAKDLSYYDGRQLFLDGKAAMWLSGSWEIYFFNEIKPDFSFSVFMLPAPKGLKTVPIFHFDAAIAINSRSKNITEAKEFINWLSTPELKKLWQDELPGFFSLAPNAPKPDDKQAEHFLRIVKSFNTDVRWVLPPGLPSSYDLMAQTTKDVLLNKLSPKEAADYLQKMLALWYEPAQLCLEKKATEKL